MLDKAPLLRIAIPFILGILLANILTIDTITIIATLAVIIFVMLFIRFRLRRSPFLALKATPWLGSLVMGYALMTGCFAGNSARPQQLDLQTINKQTIIARINAIDNKDFSTSLDATILSCPENPDALQHITPITVTITANDYSLCEGDLIAFQADLRTITSLGNPDEFDYARYMRYQGVLYSQLLKPGQYDKVGNQNTIFTISRHLQRTITNHIINSGMNPDTQRFLCTILLGESSLLKQDTRHEFSKAGISHILALSGLHMGIIVGILFALFKPLCYIGMHRLRIIIVIPVLIAYLFITGMMPSATRSAIMVLFILIANLLHRQNSSLNALLAAAIFILTLSPNSIYDVGFQLSFAAVLSILLFYDKFNTVSPSRKTLYYWTSSFTLTTVATLGTTVISAYYFHIVPMLAIISNMIILPLLPFYLSFALLHVTLLCFGIEIPEFSIFLDWATNAISTVATTIGNLPFAAITSVNISTTMLLLFFALYSFLAIWIYRKRFAYAIASLATMLVMAATDLLQFTQAPRSGFVIQNSFSATPIVAFNGGSCQIWCPDDSIETDAFVRSNIGFISHYYIDDISLTDNINHPDGIISPPFAFLENKRIAVVTNTSWRYLRAARPINVDYLVIAASYYGNITDLLDTFMPKKIVLSGGIYDDKTTEFIKEIKSIGIPFHNLHTDGALFICCSS